MKLFSLIALFLSGSISFTGLLVVRRRYRIKRMRLSQAAPAEENFWQEIADGLFSSHGQDQDAKKRTELALKSGMRRLKLGCGIIAINNATQTRVISLLTGEDAIPDWLQAGKEVSLALTYCGLLNAGRESLAIDHASLSDWRHHAAHRDLGWETFIGTRKLLSSGEYLTVGFYDWHARDQIYGREEKAFVSQLATWIAAIRESDMNESDVIDSFPSDLAITTFAGGSGVQLSQ